MLRAVIFDVDGTLVDSNELHVQAWDETFRRYGKQFSHKQLHEHIGEGGDQYIPNFLSEAEIREFGAHIEKERGELYKQKYLPHVRAFPGVRELFQRIRADGKRIAPLRKRSLWATRRTTRWRRSASRCRRSDCCAVGFPKRNFVRQARSGFSAMSLTCSRIMSVRRSPARFLVSALCARQTM
jgi:beta-phosphoglucomutase-like phosphatase (HAD superfamily)